MKIFCEVSAKFKNFEKRAEERRLAALDAEAKIRERQDREKWKKSQGL